MRHQYISYTDFKENFIDKPDGFMPVYACFYENEDGDMEKIVLIDFICEWRLSDGKVKFLQVPFDTPEQLEEIKNYIKLCSTMLQKKTSERADKLSFSVFTKE